MHQRLSFIKFQVEKVCFELQALKVFTRYLVNYLVVSEFTDFNWILAKNDRIFYHGENIGHWPCKYTCFKPLCFAIVTIANLV